MQIEIKNRTITINKTITIKITKLWAITSVKTYYARIFIDRINIPIKLSTIKLKKIIMCLCPKFIITDKHVISFDDDDWQFVKLKINKESLRIMKTREYNVIVKDNSREADTFRNLIQRVNNDN